MSNNRSNRIVASPLAHHLSKQAQIDLSQVTGSGPKGRIIKRDIEAVLRGDIQSRPPSAETATNQSNTAIKPPLTDARAFYATDDYDEQKLDNMRAAIATRLSQSTQQIPHIYLTRRLSLDALLAYRATINPQLEDSGEKISINDLVIKGRRAGVDGSAGSKCVFRPKMPFCAITMPISAWLSHCRTG